MGWWWSATFKEYIREELACFSHGMSQNMKQKFNFVNKCTAGFTFFPSFVALVHKNPSYIECTRFSCNILLIYLEVWFPILHQAPPPPRWTNLSFIWLMCLLTAHVHSMGTLNVPIWPLLTEIWGETVVDFWVVWGLGDIGQAIS